MILFRYLLKEVITTLLGLTSILLLIFMSNQLVHYLSRAANGQFPGIVVFQLMMLELPNLLGLLLPLGFYVALLIAYGRLYAENEMTVMQSCGFSTQKLCLYTFTMAGGVSIIVTLLVLWVNPLIAIQRFELLRTTGLQIILKTIPPKQFRAISGEKNVFYVDSLSRDHTQANTIFLAQLQQKQGMPINWNVLTAKTGRIKSNPHNHEEYVVLTDGKEYEGVPGKANYRVVNFSSYTIRLPHPHLSNGLDIRTLASHDLWPLNNSDKQKAAELQWRLAIPLMVLALTWVAIPLSKVNPRQGKFSRLLPALILYILYANLLFISRNWLIAGKIPIWIGLWWLPLSVSLLGIMLLYKGNHH